jgi:hypothetical protein
MPLKTLASRHFVGTPAQRPKYAPKLSRSMGDSQVAARIGVVCKTVGLAYVGSNPTPATTSDNSPWPASTWSRAVTRPVRPCPAWTGHLRLVPENTRRSSATVGAIIAPPRIDHPAEPPPSACGEAATVRGWAIVSNHDDAQGTSACRPRRDHGPSNPVRPCIFPTHLRGLPATATLHIQPVRAQRCHPSQRGAARRAAPAPANPSRYRRNWIR